MSQIRLKIFSSESRAEGNRKGRVYDDLLNSWLENRDDIEIIDYEFKSIRKDDNSTILIIKYKLSNKRKLVTEKQE